MSYSFSYAARSTVGLVRSSNQDSGYASPNMLVVADGMGGHAGGDVASTIAIEVLRALDHPDHTPATALADLELALDHSQVALTRASGTAPQLQGLGTTVIALLRTGNTLVMAHMGDSRAYLLRGGRLSQVTVDHTFVQHLVDTNRITAEEAECHPQRNVVMRVLSDFELDVHPDVSVREAKIGDRWLLCSDGLSGFVDAGALGAILSGEPDPGQAAEKLIELSLKNHSTDNVTCIVADIVPDPESQVLETQIVGAASSGGPMPELVAAVVVRDDPEDRYSTVDLVDTAELRLGLSSPSPLPSPVSVVPQAIDLPTSIAWPVRPKSHKRIDPLYLDESLESLAKPARRRPWIALTLTALLVLGAFIGVWQAHSWVQRQYYVGIFEGHVAIFRGIPENIGPFELSRPIQLFTTQTSRLPALYVGRLTETIRANSFEDANDRANRLIFDARPNPLDIYNQQTANRG